LDGTELHRGLPESLLRVGEALTSALAPPTEFLPQSAADVGVGERLSRFVGRLPPLERFGVLSLLRFIQILPLFVGPRRRLFLSLTDLEQQEFVQRLARSSFGGLRAFAKVGGMLLGPLYYGAPEVRSRLGDRTAERSSAHGSSFEVERGEDLPDQLDVEVVVVGSGAGGAPLAAELASQGREVLVLEAGGYRPTASYPALSIDALRELYRSAGAVMTLGAPPIALPLGSLVGGTTVINSGTCFRVPEFVHEKWASRYGFGENLSAAALAPYYERVETRIGVQPVSPDVMGANNDLARRGSAVLGWSGGYLSRNARDCAGSNRCAFGCPTEAKQAMHITYLPDAVASGARVVAGARVSKVTFDGRRATGVLVEVRDSEGRSRTVRVRADQVVVSAGTVHTPLLLRASGVRHRSLGKRMTIHPGVKISGLFPGQDFFSGPGVPQSYYVDEFQEQGIMMEGVHVPPDMLCFSLPGKGHEHKALMERSREIASYGFLVSDEPSGSVHRGFSGEALLRYDISKRDMGLMNLGIKKLAELFFAAGAEELYMPSWKLPVVRPGDDVDAIVDAAKLRPIDLEVAAFHPLGTCGFGPQRARFPLDTNLAVRGRTGLHVVDGSVMPSSLAVNPQLTIMALALRLAEHLEAEVL